MGRNPQENFGLGPIQSATRPIGSAQAWVPGPEFGSGSVYLSFVLLVYLILLLYYVMHIMRLEMIIGR